MATKKKRKAAKPTAGGILKLNLGAGNLPLDGYENVDRKTGQEVYPLAYPDGSADEIRASHVLEHFSHRETLDVLADWFRVLKPGGVMKIAVPDVNIIARGISEGRMFNFEGYLMGGHVDADDRHGALFNIEKLCEFMAHVGLERVHHWKPMEPDCSSLPISLNLLGYKPSAATGSLAFEGVTFCLASPRYGPSEHHRCIYETLTGLRARIRMVSGCFWNQHLCEAMEAEIERPDCRYICTLDYDSLFNRQDVAEMYRIMETRPDIDALVPLQSGRGNDKALFTMRDANGNPMAEVRCDLFEKATTPIATGHFGLTFIRAEKLRTLPRPWMVGVPDSEGRWRRPGSVDPDIYFWQRWHEHGLSVHLASRVVIGHIEDMVMWPTDDLSPCYQRVTDYIQHGKPSEAR